MRSTDRSPTTWRSCPAPTARSMPMRPGPRNSSSTSPATSRRSPPVRALPQTGRWKHQPLPALFSPALLPGRVVSLAGAHLVLLVVSHDLDLAVLAIGSEIRRFVGNMVLAAQLVLNLGEGVGHILNLEREEGLAAGLLGEVFQDLVAAQFQPTGIG